MTFKKCRQSSFEIVGFGLKANSVKRRRKKESMTVWLSKLRVSILKYHKRSKESQSVLLPAHTGKKVAARNVCQRVGGAAVKKKKR